MTSEKRYYKSIKNKKKQLETAKKIFKSDASKKKKIHKKSIRPGPSSFSSESEFESYLLLSLLLFLLFF